MDESERGHMINANLHYWPVYILWSENKYITHKYFLFSSDFNNREHNYHYLKKEKKENDTCFYEINMTEEIGYRIRNYSVCQAFYCLRTNTLNFNVFGCEICCDCWGNIVNVLSSKIMISTETCRHGFMFSLQKNYIVMFSLQKKYIVLAHPIIMYIVLNYMTNKYDTVETSHYRLQVGFLLQEFLGVLLWPLSTHRIWKHLSFCLSVSHWLWF